MMNITPAPLLEIRVHGIGDKDALASLGSPTVVDTVDGRAELVTAPPLPGHRVLLVNWARWNRSGSAFGWIASWPFSLLNAAGEMRPPGRAGGRHGLLINALALTATALAHVWLAAALEVVSLLIPASDDLRRWPSAVAVALAGVVLLAVLGQRAMSAQPPPRFVTAAHALVVVGVAGTLVLLRPSQLRADIGSVLFRGFAVDSYSTADFDRIGEVYAAGPGVEPVLTTAYLDPLAWVGYLTLTFAGVLLLMGLVLHRTPSTQCALLLGGIAVTLVNLYGAVLVALTQSAVTALQGVSVVQRLSTTQPRLDDVILIGRTGQGLSSRMLPLVTVLALIATLLISALVGGRSPLGALRAGDRRAALNRWAHTTLPTIGARLTNILWFVSIATLLLVELLGLGVGVFADRWGGYRIVNNVQSFEAGPLVTVLVSASGAVLTAALFTLRNASVRAKIAQVLAFVGDVIGFWPISTHPLAARSYRPAALEAIRRAVPDAGSARTVLVGHSQGSVLASWHVAHAPGSRLALVTCGSPLVSLYSQFFPTHFDQAFFAAVNDTAHTWTNVWRDTDPIATVIPEADRNIQVPDPTADGVLHCHSDYWTDPLQAAAVLAGAPPQPIAPPT